MFGKNDISYLQQSAASGFVIYQLNSHDTSIHSRVTGHDWIVISSYDSESCFILHRHDPRYPYHRQRGRYSSLTAALDYIIAHEKWVSQKRRQGPYKGRKLDAEN